MDENNTDDSAKQIPLRDLRVDPAAMEPYLNLAVASPLDNPSNRESLGDF